jgi:hypothetical protein
MPPQVRIAAGITIAVMVVLFSQTGFAGCPDGAAPGLGGWCWPNIPNVGMPDFSNPIEIISPFCWGHPQDCRQPANIPPPPQRISPGPNNQPPALNYGGDWCAGPGDEPYPPQTVMCWGNDPNEQTCSGIPNNAGAANNGQWVSTGRNCGSAAGGVTSYYVIAKNAHTCHIAVRSHMPKAALRNLIQYRELYGYNAKGPDPLPPGAIHYDGVQCVR